MPKRKPKADGKVPPPPTPGEKTSPAGAKFTLVERDKVISQVGMLYRRGWDVADIADRCKVSVGTVREYLEVIRRRYVTEGGFAGEEAKRAFIQSKLDEYRDVKREAWAAWERSKEDTSKRVEEQAVIQAVKIGPEARGKGRSRTPPVEENPKPVTTRITLTTEGRLPASQYLAVIADCIKGERELLGLDAPKQVKAAVTVINFDDLAKGVAEGRTAEDVEAEINAIYEKAGLDPTTIEGETNVVQPNQLPHLNGSVNGTNGNH